MTAETPATDTAALVDLIEEPAIEPAPGVSAAVELGGLDQPGPPPVVAFEPGRSSAGDAGRRVAAVEAGAAISEAAAAVAPAEIDAGEGASTEFMRAESARSERAIAAEQRANPAENADLIGQEGGIAVARLPAQTVGGSPAAPSSPTITADRATSPLLRIDAPSSPAVASPDDAPAVETPLTIAAAVSTVERTPLSPPVAVSNSSLADTSQSDPRALCLASLGGALDPAVIYYEPGATAVPPEMRFVLLRFIDSVPASCTDFLRVEGHTDASETDDRADSALISRQRAVGVAALLAKADLFPAPERVVHFGDAAPARDDHGAWNMRVVVSLDVGADDEGVE